MPVGLLKTYDSGMVSVRSIVSAELVFLYEPNKIINNLILGNNPMKAAKLNKQKINELTFALRFFKLFNEAIIKLSSDRADKDTLFHHT